MIWSGGRDGFEQIDRENGMLNLANGSDRPMKYVYALVPADSILYAGHSEGLSLFYDNSWRTLTEADGLPWRTVLAVIASPTSGLWVGTESGLLNMNEHKAVIHNRSSGMASDRVFTLCEDNQGRIWAGSGPYAQHAGLSMWDGKVWRTYSVQDGLAHPMVNHIYQARSGDIWFATGFSSRGGASRFDGRTWTTFTQKDGLPADHSRYIFEDSLGGLWIGSESAGITRFFEGSTRTFSVEDGLAGLEVKAMMEDSRGSLWLGTERGLTRIDAPAWKTPSWNN